MPRFSELHVAATSVECVLVAIWADPGYYICPSSLERASFCLASSSWLQCAVIAAYLHLLLAARRLCCGHVGSEERCRRGSRGLVWVIWIAVLLILSLLGCIVMATKSVPDFLSLPSSWLTILSLCVGACQALLIKFVIPQISTRLDKRNSGALESLASVCTTWVAPSLVTLYLDEACWGYWTRWWWPCYFQGKAELEFELRLLVKEGHLCRQSSGHTSASCAGGTMRKMQAMLLGKLILTGLVFPIANVSVKGLTASRSIKMMSKLATLLGLALISVPSLPLMVPLFTMTAFCEAFMAAVRYSDRSEDDSTPPVPKGRNSVGSLASRKRCDSESAETLRFFRAPQILMWCSGDFPRNLQQNCDFVLCNSSLSAPICCACNFWGR